MSKRLNNYKFRIFQWTISSFWPVCIFIIGGGWYFQDAISASIKSTPDPAIVYMILGAILFAVALLIYAFVKYSREEYWLANIESQISKDGQINLNSKYQRSLWHPVYHLIALDSPIDVIRPMVEIEAEKSRESFNALLQYPSYIAGALVGMGLVGTFVGLLSTLRDLGAVFALMANMGGDVDPTQMFGQMILKLQDPIKGMGTAFVASLYGLMGSLIVGVVVLAVRRVGEHVSLDVERFMERALSNKANRQAVNQNKEVISAHASDSILHQSLTGHIHALEQSLSTLTSQIMRYEKEMAGLSKSILKTENSRLKVEKLLLYCLIILFTGFLGASVLWALPLWNTSHQKIEEVIVSSNDFPVRKIHEEKEFKALKESKQPKIEADQKAYSRVIKKGDNLYSIAKQCYISLSEINSLNPNYAKNPKNLRVDSHLIVPDSSCADSN